MCMYLKSADTIFCKFPHRENRWMEDGDLDCLWIFVFDEYSGKGERYMYLYLKGVSKASTGGVFSSPVRKYRKSYCSHPSPASALA